MADRSYYEGLTKIQLQAICRQRDLKNFSKLLKAPLIDLIMTTEESPEPVSKASALGTKVSKSKVPKKIENVPKKSKDKPVVKVTQRESGSTEVAKSSQPKKSGALYISIIEDTMKDIQMYVDARNRAKAIEKAEIIQNYLKNYDFSNLKTYKAAMERSIASVVLAFDSSSPFAIKPLDEREKPAPKAPGTKIYKKGIYKQLETTVSVGVKGAVLPENSEEIKPINITLQELRKEIDNDDFIRDYTESVRELMKVKIGMYRRRKEETEKEYEMIKRKVDKLKSMGTDERAIRDMYPGFDGLKVFIIDLQDLMELVAKRAQHVSTSSIREGLIDALEDPERGLNAIIGREELKDQLASQIYSFSKGYKTFVGSFNNIAIYGPAGVGKTRIATTMAFALSKIGILAKDTVKIVTRADLVGQYIGHTAPRTRSALIETLEGILFIDEAYQLTSSEGGKDFGGEAITEIVNFLDKYIGLNIVIVAGYEGIMTRQFMTFNEGLPRRFPYRYVLSSYDDTELTDILVSNLKRKLPSSIVLDEDVQNLLFSLVVEIKAKLPDAFKNQAGDMLNLSSSLNKTISSSFKVKWKPGNLKNNKTIILAGFQDFLDVKGFFLRI